MNDETMDLPIEDVQSRADTRRIPINKVGIKSLRHPVRVSERGGGVQHTIANFNMYVDLPHNFKGTHMSRFVEILHHEREIGVTSFKAMLEEIRRQRLKAVFSIEYEYNWDNSLPEVTQCIEFVKNYGK